MRLGVGIVPGGNAHSCFAAPWRLIAIATALVALVALVGPAAAGADEPSALPPPPLPPPASQLLLINVGWENAQNPSHSAPLVPGDLETTLNHLRNYVNPWFREASSGIFGGWTIVSGGSHQIPSPKVLDESTCDADHGKERGQLHKEVVDSATAAAGVDPSAYSVVIVKYSKVPLCGFAGQADAIGGRSILIGQLSGAPIHELGHLFGLHHANMLACKGPGGVPVPLSESCESVEYGDLYDTMGVGPGGNQGLFNALELNALGWLNDQVVNMSAPGPAQTVTLRPLSEPGAGPRAVRLVDGSTTLWIEYRQPTGLDASNGNAVVDGLLVHRELQNSGGLPSSQLLDMSPGPTDGRPTNYDARLKVGYSWENPLGEMRITLNSETKTGATVTVSSRRETDFSFGKLKRNKKTGTAIQVVNLPIPVVGSGTLKLSGQGLFATVKHTRGGPQTLTIRTTGRKQKTLKRKGRVTLRARFTYTPTGGYAATKVKTILLVKKR